MKITIMKRLTATFVGLFMIAILGFGQWQGTDSSAYFLEGNVGIGTDSPDALLEVAGFRFGGPQGNLPEPNDLFVVGGSLPTIAKTDFVYGSNWSKNGAFWAMPMIYRSRRYPNDASGSFPFNQYGELIIQGVSHGNSNALGPYNKGISFVTWDGTENDPEIRIRIKEDGNIGIGTTSPSEKLEINGNVLIKDNNALILTSPNGTAFKITVDDNGNLSTSQTTSIELPQIDYDIEIFPNPTYNELNVSVNNQNINELDVEIYNLIGKMIFMKNYSSNKFQINTRDLPGGTYLLKLKDSDGNLIKTEKFIKQ